MPDFIPGLELGRRFFADAIQPILNALFPDLRCDAALIGPGSEILGFDTARSTDHGWGPRGMLFLSEADHALYADSIVEVLCHQLPHRFLGYPTGYTAYEAEPETPMLDESDSGPVNHRVEVTTIRRLLRGYLAYEWDQPPTAADWLTFTEQKLRTLTSGAVYHEGVGDLALMRERLRYYPRDVWLYRLASGWQAVGQEEPFVGRCGDVGDDLGSRIITARLVQRLMRLCFLIERVYAPYSKWFGTAFARLTSGPDLAPILTRTLAANEWHEREEGLTTAYTYIARMHNALNITAPLATEGAYFYDRPYRVIHAERFAQAIRAQIQDESIRQMPLIGGIEQFSDSTDLLAYANLRQPVTGLFK